jgi:methylmalonyl-CoA/ethylmalonyl-CoA epimerase
MASAKAVNHIGIAVSSIAENREFYENVLGAEFMGIEEVPDQKIRVGFFKVGDVKLELLEPTDAESTVAKFIEKRGEGLHHVAYTVDNIVERIAEFKSKGVRMIDEKPRAGAHKMQIAFLHPKSSHSVLTELCEPQKGH